MAIETKYSRVDEVNFVEQPLKHLLSRLLNTWSQLHFNFLHNIVKFF